MLAIVPSSTASNSIVALSVSISAMMSPERTVSPTLISHLASVPSSIVGDSAGILISIAMELPIGGRGHVVAPAPRRVNPCMVALLHVKGATRTMPPMRIYLVVIDDTPEAGIALRFAARRAVKTGGGVEILALVEPPEFIAFGGVQATIEDEARQHAQGLVAEAAGALDAEAGLKPIITVRSGDGPKVIRDMIAANPDIAALVLGACASGAPGPLITHFRRRRRRRVARPGHDHSGKPDARADRPIVLVM